MSTFDLETTGTDHQRPAVRHEGSGPDASTVMGLQRLAGNSAVAAAIRSGQIGSDSGPINLQRLADEDEDEGLYDEDEAETAEDVDQSAGGESGAAEDMDIDTGAEEESSEAEAQVDEGTDDLTDEDMEEELETEEEEAS